MKIITAPHQTLRATAEPISEINDATLDLLKSLKTDLDEQRNPTGVGLAGPQVDQSLRAFAARPMTDGDPLQTPIRVFINPKIINHSQNQVLGQKHEQPDLEGCLSIPQIYGEVPRWQWVELEFQTLENNKLVDHKEKFFDYAARIMQHELDHLNGILFTDYILQYETPAYIVNKKNQLEELDHLSILEVY